MGARPRRDKSAGRLTQRIKNRMRPGPLIFNSLFGVARHAVTAGIYLGLAYGTKLAFGVSLVFNAMH
jgi:hypothetical protein